MPVCDPRIDPQPGDRVRGEKASAIIRVTARDDTPLGVEFVTGDGNVTARSTPPSGCGESGVKATRPRSSRRSDEDPE
jgi:hypothetical protein